MMARWFYVVAVTSCLLAVATPASALCLPLMKYPQPDVNSSISFMEAMIDSLVYLKVAGTSVKEGGSTGELLVGLAARKEAYECGSDILSRFTVSTNPFVAKVSEMGGRIYTSLVEITGHAEELIKNFANRPEKPRRLSQCSSKE